MRSIVPRVHSRFCAVVVLKFPRWFLVYNLQWKFENETKLSISMAWIGKRQTGEASVS